jgi:hypothetical protein
MFLVAYMKASQFKFRGAVGMKSFTILTLCGIFFLIMVWYNLEMFKNSDVLYISIGDIEEQHQQASEEEDPMRVRNLEDDSAVSADGENVFFVETQNTTRHDLSDRQACSIESAGTHRSFLRRCVNFFGNSF